MTRRPYCIVRWYCRRCQRQIQEVRIPRTEDYRKYEPALRCRCGTAAGYRVDRMEAA